MSLNRWAKKRDDNEQEIIKALESIGCTVHRLDQPVDLLVGRGAKNILIEVKDGNKVPSARKLTTTQRDFFKMWKGQVCTITTAAQAIEVVQRITRKNDY